MALDPSHSLLRQIGIVRQALEDSKRPIGILLGAGVSASLKQKGGEPLIPDLAAMTDLMKGELAKTSTKETLQIVAAQLHKTKANANIEDFLTHVRSLAEVADALEIKGLSAKLLRELDGAISAFIRAVTSVALPEAMTPFDQLAVWIRSANRSHPVEVFTLNYDVLVEQALERNRVPFFDGFLGAKEPFFDGYAIESESKNLPARWARLWKLHGSVNWWAREGADGLDVRRSESGEGYNSLIHPSHLKYDQARQMPYLAMLERLKRFLTQPRAALIVSGYSFRDSHINALIAQTLAGQTSSTVLAFMRSALSKYEGLQKMAQSLPSLNVFAKDFGVIGGRIGKWAVEDGETLLPYGMTSEATGEGGTALVKSTLGDFVEMGKLLHDLTGSPIVPTTMGS